MSRLQFLHITQRVWAVVCKSGLSALIVCTISIGREGQAVEQPDSTQPMGKLVTLDIHVDGKPAGKWQLLERNGVFLAPATLFEQWHLNRRSNTDGIEYDNRIWYSLASVPNIEIVYFFTEPLLQLKQTHELSTHLVKKAATQSTIPPMPVASRVSREANSTLAPAQNSRPSPQTKSTESATRLVPLDVSINGAQAGSWLLLERGGELYAPGEALSEWRVEQRPDEQGIEYRGQIWYRLASLPGFEVQLNAANQSVDLKFLAHVFAATHLSQESAEVLPRTPAVPAFFANYDLNQTVSQARGLGARHALGALMELGLSGEYGVFTSSHVGQNLLHGNGGSPSSWRRLETAFSRDFPEHNLSLRIGDTVTRAGTWGRSTYMGGIQLTRNFALTPGFITQPIPIIAGQSTAPSTVELYINDSLRQTSQVPAGPFAIDNFPQLTGTGQARLVVRDVLGRETVLVQNFFSHTDLLEKGLSDWSLDIGAVRKNLAIDNANYGRRFGSGLWRYGLNKQLTLEARGEAGKDSYGAGLGFSAELPGQMLGQVAIAASHDRAVGSGQQWLLGIERSSLRHGFTLRAEGATHDYRPFEQDTDTLSYRMQLSASYTFNSEKLGNLGLGYARIDSFDHGPLTTYSANYSLTFGARNSLTFNATHVAGAANGNSNSVGFNLLIPLDHQTSITGGLTRRGSQTDAYVSASKGLAVENSTSWRAQAGTRARQTYAEGGWYYQGSRGLFTSEISVTSGQQTARLGAQGGLVWIDGNLFASRKIQDSFALVEVPGYADVGVGFQSSIFARTNADGRALLTRLLPYRKNSIRLDPTELPISAELDSIEQVVVPAARVGVKVPFPVREGRGALITVLFDDDKPAPAGAEIRLEGESKEFFVARRGESFVTGLKPMNILSLNWNGYSCRMKIDLPPGKLDEIARIGPIICKGVPR